MFPLFFILFYIIQVLIFNLKFFHLFIFALLSLFSISIEILFFGRARVLHVNWMVCVISKFSIGNIKIKLNNKSKCCGIKIWIIDQISSASLIPISFSSLFCHQNFKPNSIPKPCNFCLGDLLFSLVDLLVLGWQFLWMIY